MYIRNRPRKFMPDKTGHSVPDRAELISGRSYKKDMSNRKKRAMFSENEKHSSFCSIAVTHKKF